jgi:hypothetical protein
VVGARRLADLPAELREEIGLTVGGRGEAFILRYLETDELRDLEGGINLCERDTTLVDRGGYQRAIGAFCRSLGGSDLLQGGAEHASLMG